jgi:hypothetical protein
LEDLDLDGNDNIAIDLRKMGWEGVDCSLLFQDRDQSRTVVNTVINVRVV